MLFSNAREHLPDAVDRYLGCLFEMINHLEEIRDTHALEQAEINLV